MPVEQKIVREEQEILDMLFESSLATQRLDDEYEQLKADYPDQWVAVSKDGLVAHHEDLDGIIASFQEAGYENTQVVVEFLNTKPRIMLL